MILIILSCLVLFTYSSLIIYYLIGWNRLSETNNSKIDNQITIDVIVPFKDEEKNILRLVKGLKEQKYENNNLNFILVNDHSEDASEKIARNAIKDNNRFTIYSLSKQKEGKKAALSFGIKNSKSEKILFTDADCTHNKYWISDMVGYCLEKNADMVMAPVIYKKKKGFVSMFSEFENIALMMVTASSVYFGKPVMANGANMLIKKNVFRKSHELFNDKYTSGDDTFLMLQIKKDKRKKIVFNKSARSIVYSDPPEKLKDFINQRMRWVSKCKGISDYDIVRDAVIIFFTNFLLFVLLVLGIFSQIYLLTFICTFILKTLIDTVFIYRGLKYFGKKTLIKYVFLFQIFNFLYVPFVSVYGSMVNFKWKDRAYKN